MPFGLLSDYLPNYTSDHTYQKTTVESYSKADEVLILRGMTWNMLNQCYGKSDQFKFSNNPFNFDELAIGYTRRKKQQLKFLFKEIQSKSLDFIVLQEVDVFVHRSLPDFVTDFLVKINSKNWGTVHSTQADDLSMPLLLLYDKSKLEFISQRAIFPRDGDNKKCALEATFKYKDTDLEVCIVNMHLDYNTDHSAAIFEYQQQQITAGKFTVIGGDANHKERYFNLAGDRLVFTNIANPDTDRSLTGEKLLQRLDGFMASPAHDGATVTLIEGVCGYFVWREPNKINTLMHRKKGVTPVGKYIFKILDPTKRQLGGHVKHTSKIGAPYLISGALYMAISSGTEKTDEH